MNKTISTVKKNQINLYELKKLSEMKFVEKSFEIFLKKKFFKNDRSKKKYLFKNKFCPCGSKFSRNNFKFFIKPFTFIECNICNTISIDPMINDDGLNVIYSQKGIYSLYSKVFFETVYNLQRKRIFNALKNSSSDSVIKFKEVLKKIIDGK